MPKVIQLQLWRLIKSLSKSEKRNFKLFAKRAGATQQSKFIRLFDVIDQMTNIDNSYIKKRLNLSSTQYSNLKRHLYHQVLTSLRMVYISKEVDIEIREQIDFSRILYGKGHFLDALRTLERAKEKALVHSQDLLHLEILEFQKLIEARHVTLSLQVDNKLDLLLNESAKRCFSVLDTSELFSLNIQIHGRYIKLGHSRTPAQIEETKRFWISIQTERADRITSSNTFNQKVNRFQAMMWYHYIQLDFGLAYSSARDASALFSLSKQMIFMDPELYLRSLYHVALFAYLNGDEKAVARYLDKINLFLSDDQIQLNENSRMIGAVYLNLAKYHLYFMTKNGEAARQLGASLSLAYSNGSFHPNQHRWGLFLYKYAAALFLNGDYNSALDHLIEIINMRTSIFREDLLISTRLLHAICNFELENYSLLEYHLTNFSRLLRKSQATAEVHKLAVTALGRLLKLPETERQPVYQGLFNSIALLDKLPFEQKALNYLDLRQWLKGKI